MSLPSKYRGPSMQAREAIAREAKVANICRHLHRQGIDADEARTYSLAEWAEVARAAHVHPPSQRSVASILERMTRGRDLDILSQLKVDR